MTTWLVIAIFNMEGFFIYDTYNTYIVKAESKDKAKSKVEYMPNVIGIDTVSSINDKDASALISINRTKQISDEITQIILYA